MTNKEAYQRALKALDQADTAQGKDYVENGGGWGDMSAGDIRLHITEYLAYAFKQGPKPDDMTG